MYKFIGDLSIQDYDVLVKYASSAENILEFGVGGSTQVMAQAKPNSGRFFSIDTDERLKKLNVSSKVTFASYDNWYNNITNIEFDLIFDDGVDCHRRQFGLDSWNLLKPGGVMIFHDTRRFQDFVNVAWVAQTFFLEVENISVNEKVDGVASNISIIRKKVKEDYINWNYSEGKDLYNYGGFGKEPDSFWE